MKKVSFIRKKFNSMLATSTVTMVVSILLLIANSLIVGNIVGEDGLAAINVLTPVVSLVYYISGLIAMGSVYMFCRAIGEFDTERAEKIFGQGVILSVLSGIVLFLLMVFGKEAFFAYFGLSGVIRTEAESYWKFAVYAVLFVPLNFLLSEIVYAEGDMPICNISNLVRILGQILLAIVLTKRIGTGGAALAELISGLLSLIVLIFHFFRKNCQIRFRWHLSFADIKKMCALSLLDANTYLWWGALILVINKFVIAHFGEEYLCAVAVAVNVLEVSLIFDGVGEALTPIAETYLGERNFDSERAAARYGLFLCMAEGVLCMLLLLLFAPAAPRLFDIKDPVAAAAAVSAIRYMSPFLPFSSAVFLFSSHYLLIRRIALATVMSGLSQFGYNALMSCLLGRVFGWKGVWLGFALSYLLGLLSGLLYIRLRHGKEMVPWMLPHNEHPTHSISLYFNEASVLSVRDEMGMFLGGCGVPSGCISASMLAIEECGMNIADRNPGKDIVGEYTVTADGENVVMYIRDSGVLFDMSDPDNRIDSFRSYVISSFMERHSDRRYLVTLSNNRLMLSVPYGASAGNHLKE